MKQQPWMALMLGNALEIFHYLASGQLCSSCFFISTINTINSFEAIWLTTAGGPSDATVILPIFAYKGLTSFNIGQSAAAALSLVPVAIVITFFVLRKMKKDQ